ncbi:hypothetical protein RB195_000415 [Necator americanus]
MTSYLQKETIPDQWKTSRTVLIHKKGDREDLRNYRPICLLSVLYKVFTKIILTRISRTLDEAQPREQAGFRQGFSCLDHIQTVSRVICYAAETWADTTATSRKLLTTHRALERSLLKFNRRTQHLAGLRSSDLRGVSRPRDPAEYVSKAKHRWAGHIMRRIDDRWTKRTLEWIPRDAKRPRGRPPTRWGDVFAARMDQLRAHLGTAQGPRQRHSRSLRTSWMTMARERNEWKRCWGPHVQ